MRATPFPLRVLLVRVGAMGDVIHALPAVAALRAALPDAHLGWAIEPRWSALLHAPDATPGTDGMPLVNTVHPVEAKRWNRRPFSASTAASIAGLRRQLREERYDLAVDLQGTLRSAAIARMSGATHTVGSATPRERLAARLYRTRVLLTATHVTDQALDLVRAALHEMGRIPVPAIDGTGVLLPRDAAAEAWWRERQAELCGDRPAILLCATAGWGAKEWPPSSFADLAMRLAGQGFCVLLNAAPGHPDPATAEVLERVAAAGGPERTRVHPLMASLPQMIAAVRTVQAVIGGDTGPLHLAAALGVPTVGLFGPTAPERTGPRHARGRNLRHPSSVTDHRRHAETEPGLREITADAVLAALTQVLEAR